MYQSVFVSVFSVILVLKLVFLAGSLVFTIKYDNQISPRNSVSSAPTTSESVESLDEQSVNGTDELGESPHRCCGSTNQDFPWTTDLLDNESGPSTSFFDALMGSDNVAYNHDTSL